MKALHNR